MGFDVSSGISSFWFKTDSIEDGISKGNLPEGLNCPYKPSNITLSSTPNVPIKPETLSLMLARIAGLFKSTTTIKSLSFEYFLT